MKKILPYFAFMAMATAMVTSNPSAYDAPSLKGGSGFPGGPMRGRKKPNIKKNPEGKKIKNKLQSKSRRTNRK